MRLSGATRTGTPWLRAALVAAGQAAGRTKQRYLGAQFRRLVVRRGKKRAAVAVGHRSLVIADHLLTEHATDQELGVPSFDQRQQQAVERRRGTRHGSRRLADLGDKVTLAPIAA
jgi:hypothetical protein